MIKHINFVSIPCTDQKRALEFYTKRLGLSHRARLTLAAATRHHPLLEQLAAAA